MVEITKECALMIQPMVRYLYTSGITSICPYQNRIHCADEFFIKAFPEYKVREYNDEYEEAYVKEDGVEWFCLIEKGEK